MKVFALADLHLSFAETPVCGRGEQQKPMSVFGGHWEDYCARIYDFCSENMSGEDWLLCAGDISWAMQYEQTAADFAYLGSLPCRVVITRGNHDYWWGGIGKLRSLLPPNCHALQNDAMSLDGKLALAGTRGWALPNSADWKQHDEKIFLREQKRLEMSLQEAQRLELPIIAMLHYPPLLRAEETAFSRLLTAYRVRHCVYGHLHGAANQSCFEGEFEKVIYHNTAADRLAFCPKLILED